MGGAEGAPSEGKGGNYLIHGFNLKEAATSRVYGGSSSTTTCHINSTFAVFGVSGSGATEHVDVLDGGVFNEQEPAPPVYGGQVLTFGRGGSGCPVPTAKFKANGVEEGAEVETGKTVTFDASGSELASGPTSAPGFRKELIWKFGDGTEQVVTSSGSTEALATVTHAYASPGTYTATLQIHLKTPTYGNPVLVEHKVVVKGGSAPKKFKLTVTGHGSGSGTVTSNPLGIECGVTCEAEFEEGKEVKLTGTPSSGSLPVTWEGCDSVNGSNECVVKMTAAKAVIATFNEVPKFALKVVKAGNGTGSLASSPAGINCGTECEAKFEEGKSVTLTAAPATGSKVAFTGCDTTSGNECVVKMTAAKTVTATFTLEAFTLKVTKAGGGSGTVTSTPTGINCGTECEATFNFGTEVTLKAALGAGTKSVTFTGCDSTSGNECKVTVNAAKASPRPSPRRRSSP